MKRSLWNLRIWIVSLTCLAGGWVRPGAEPVPPDCRRHPACHYCGMDRQKFAHSRMLITYRDGTVVGVCSVHCAAIDLAVNMHRLPEKIQVGDYEAHALIDADSATWVLGGDLPGVMTRQAKWAFATTAEATTFTQRHGGQSAKFPDVLQAAYTDMYEDVEMIRRKRTAPK